MLPEQIIIIAFALLVFYLVMPNKLAIIAGIISAILMVGTLRHPEVALSKNFKSDDPILDFYTVMLLVGIILFFPIVKSIIFTVNKKDRK